MSMSAAADVARPDGLEAFGAHAPRPNAGSDVVAAFAGAIFVNAFLLFLLEPLFAKLALPHLGGTAAVWATCMLFFQTALLAGYYYAHALASRLRPSAQAGIHVTLLVLAALTLPVSRRWVNLKNTNATDRLFLRNGEATETTARHGAAREVHGRHGDWENPQGWARARGFDRREARQGAGSGAVTEEAERDCQESRPRSLERQAQLGRTALDTLFASERFS